MIRRIMELVGSALALAGCAAGTGVIQIGPDTYTLTELRAPVRGGGDEARRVVLLEAHEFCRAQSRNFVPIDVRPDGDPRTPYYPTAFDALFRCAVPGESTP